MIRSRIVTKIGHLTHNQVVAGSSPVDSLTIAPDKNGRLLGIPIQSSHNIDLISSTFRCEVTGYNNLDTLETKLFNNIYSLDKDYEKTCTQEYHSYHLSINNNNIK